jgi:uncharacterized protein
MRHPLIKMGRALARPVVIGIILISAFNAAPAVGAEDKLRGPWSSTPPRVNRSETPETSVPALVARGALTVWHRVLTRADGPRSVMYPTASGFLGQAVAKHGMLIGIVMTTDRLLHEWDEQARAPRVTRDGVSRTYDPVEANDFWWAQEAR